MAIADIRQRPGVVLAVAIVGHLILISAQVQTATGLPVLQAMTFGAFSEVQRGTMAIVDGVRSVWSGYVALQDVQRENGSLKQEVQNLQVRLQEERALAQRTDSLRQLLELRREYVAHAARKCDTRVENGILTMRVGALVVQATLMPGAKLPAAAGPTLLESDEDGYGVRVLKV